MSATTIPTVGARRGLLAAAVIAGLAAAAAIGAGPANATPAIFPIDSNLTVASSASAAAVVEYALLAAKVPAEHIAVIEHEWAEGSLQG